MFMFKPSLTCGVFLLQPPQRKVLPGLFGLDSRGMRGGRTGRWGGVGAEGMMTGEKGRGGRRGVVSELGQCSLNFKEGIEKG